MIKLSDYVIDFIESIGVNHVFMVPGGGAMHLVDSLGKNKNIQSVANLNEQAVSIAVESYGQYTNNIGVGLVTTGPGGTNAVTGVAAGWIDSTPMLIISGQVKTGDLLQNKNVRQMGMQEVDIISIVKPITKYAVTVKDVNKIKYYLEKAFHIATTGRKGPVWIDIPLDIQAAIIDEKNLQSYIKENNNDFDDDETKQKVSDFINLLNNSKRPVVLAGNGIRLAGKKEEFINLINRLNIPVLTTWKAIDFFDENDPLFMGRPGAIGQRGANFVQQNCDLILILGARMDYGQVGYEYKYFARSAKKVMVDIDENEIKKMNIEIDVSIYEGIELFFNELFKQINKVKNIDRKEWFDYCLKMKNKYPVVTSKHWEQKEYVNTYAFIDQLSKELGKDDLLIPGSSGSCSEITMQSFKVKKGQRIYNNEGLGSMGFGLTAAIAGCLASGCKNTITIEGDGGIQFNIQELETLKRLDIPVKVFVLNNQGYGSIKNMQENYFNGRYVASNSSSGLTLPDMCEIAKAYKIKALKIKNNNELADKLKQVLEYKKPIICEIMVSPNQKTEPKLASKKLPNGQMKSRPLEDLAPFLDEEELKQNMLIPLID